MFKKVSDLEYIEGFKNHDSKIIHRFSNEYKSKFISFLYHNYNIDYSINIEEVFNDSLADLWNNICTGEYQYQENARLETYFFSIGKNKLKKQIFQSNRNQPIEEEYLTNFLSILEPSVSKLECQTIIENLLESYLSTYSSCVELIHYFYYEKLKDKDTAKLLGFLNDDSVKSDRYKCIKRLQKKVYEVLQQQNPNNWYLQFCIKKEKEK